MQPRKEGQAKCATHKYFSHPLSAHLSRARTISNWKNHTVVGTASSFLSGYLDIIIIGLKPHVMYVDEMPKVGAKKKPPLAEPRLYI